MATVAGLYEPMKDVELVGPTRIKFGEEDIVLEVSAHLEENTRKN